MTVPTEKPADLPELPIRVRIGLWSYPLFAVFFLSVFSVGMIAGAPEDPGLFWLAAAVAIILIAFLWRGSSINHRRMAKKRRWWQVEMSQNGEDLTFHWEPKTWADLAPRIPAYMMFQIVFLSLAIGAFIIHAISQKDMPNTFLALAVVCAFVSFPLIVFSLFATFTTKQRIEAVLNDTYASSLGPPLLPGLSEGIFLQREWVNWACMKLRLSEIGDVAFAADRVKVIQRTIHQPPKRHMLIPTRPHQRRAIANWAASHAIPVTGDN